MIQRDILKTIEERLNKAGETGPVILHGMPCVGKSTLLKQLTANRGSGYILEDLTTDREFRSVLLTAINDERHDSVIQILGDYFGLSPEIFRKTLLCLDGAEYLQGSIAMLLEKDLPSQCIIATDRFDYLSDHEFPRGQCFRINVLSFSEFLSAIKKDEYREVIRARVRENKPIPGLLRDELMEQYYDYLMVGGFPQAVLQYDNDRTNISALRMVHRQILSTIVQSLNGAELELPESSSPVRLNQIFGYLKEHSDTPGTFRPGSVHRGLTARDFANEFRYLQLNSFLMPDSNIIVDTGLQRFVSNDYDTFYAIEQEHIPIRILKQSLMVSCYAKDLTPVSYDNRKANCIQIAIPELSLFITYTPHRRKSAAMPADEEFAQYKQLRISDDSSRNPDDDHNIMWYELDETLNAKKSLK